MKPEKSLKELKKETEEIKTAITKIQENTIELIREIDKDVAFFLENNETEIAGMYQAAIMQLSSVIGSHLPAAWRAVENAIDMLEKVEKEGGNGTEHQATPGK